MITSDDVLKAIVDCKKLSGEADYLDVMKKLDIDDISLAPFLKELDEKRFIVHTMESVSVTSLGLSAYKDLSIKRKVAKSFYDFSKFTLQRIVDILVGIAIGVAVTYIAFHFGWQ